MCTTLSMWCVRMPFFSIPHPSPLMSGRRGGRAQISVASGPSSQSTAVDFIWRLFSDLM